HQRGTGLSGEPAEQLLVLRLPVDDLDSRASEPLPHLGGREDVGDLDLYRRVLVIGEAQRLGYGIWVEEGEPVVGGRRPEIEGAGDRVGGDSAVGQNQLEIVAHRD